MQISPITKDSYKCDNDRVRTTPTYEHIPQINERIFPTPHGKTFSKYFLDFIANKNFNS